MRNKRGSVADIIFIAVVLFVFVLIILLLAPVYREIHADLNATAYAENKPQEVKDIINQNTPDDYIGLFDVIILTVMVLLSVAVFILAFMINTHPALYFVTLLILGFIVFISASFSNVYEDIASSDSVSSEADKFTYTNYIMFNFPVIMMALSFIIMVIMYAKGRLSG